MSSTQTTNVVSADERMGYVGGSIPNTLAPGDLMRLLNIRSRSWFCERQRKGEFDRFLLPGRRERLGQRRYSGAKVAQFLGR